MTFEEFQKASPKELTAAAKECFERSKAGINLANKAPSLIEAQFYMQELDRREDSAIARRDFWMEVFVIVLIGLELILAVWGIRLASKESANEDRLMDKQDAILSPLQQSASDTAKLIKEQLELEYALLINVEYQGSNGMQVYNNSKSPVSVEGIKMGSAWPAIKRDAQTVIPDHGMMIVNIADYNPKLLDEIRSSSKSVKFPLKLFVKNARGEEFIWKGELASKETSGNLTGHPGGVLLKEEWSGSVKFAEIP